MSIIKYLKKLRDGYVINQVKKLGFPDFAPSTVVRKSVIFTGRVQKVGFRLEIYELAKRLYITGWARNSAKYVEAELQGEADKIDYLIKFMKSLKRASVREIRIKELPVLDAASGFALVKG